MASSSNNADVSPLVGVTITEKLNKTNHAIWKAQILAAVRGACLVGHLTGATPAPAEETTGKDSVGKEIVISNPAYEEWYVKDHAVAGLGDGRDPPDDVAGEQVHDADLAIIVERDHMDAGEDGVAGRVGPGEARVGGERLPGPADGTEAAEVVGREAEQDIVQHVFGKHAVGGEVHGWLLSAAEDWSHGCN
jgi:hypothetical protein